MAAEASGLAVLLREANEDGLKSGVYPTKTVGLARQARGMSGANTERRFVPDLKIGVQSAANVLKKRIWRLRTYRQRARSCANRRSLVMIVFPEASTIVNTRVLTPSSDLAKEALTLST